MQQWEYQVVRLSWNAVRNKWVWKDTDKSESEQSQEVCLNQMGRENWELTSVTSRETDGSTSLLTFYFKRPISN
jgi:hypothetical protein